MYTHISGYKFGIRVGDNTLYNYLCVTLYSMPGEFDSQLNWSAKAMFTIELIHQQRRKNAVCVAKASWRKPKREDFITFALSLVDISKLDDFLVNDTLYFCISKVEIL